MCPPLRANRKANRRRRHNRTRAGEQRFPALFLYREEENTVASTQEYRDYILDQLTGLEGISCRAMMGEYLLYCQGKLVGGIYDNRLLGQTHSLGCPAAARCAPGTAL